MRSMLFNRKIDEVPAKYYRPILTLEENKKGVLDLDTVKGCSSGLEKYPNGGCYGECYAYKIAKRIDIDFTKSISRKIIGTWHLCTLKKLMAEKKQTWYRIGVMGDPSYDWENTIFIINAFRHLHRIPVVVTKHWIRLTDDQISKLKYHNVIIHTSISGLDTDEEISYRVGEFLRLQEEGIQSICRIVSCNFGSSQWANERNEKQNYLLSFRPLIDTPLRASRQNAHVINGDIILNKRPDCIGGGKLVSLHSSDLFLGKCDDCPDDCGIDEFTEPVIEKGEIMIQPNLFKEKIEFIYVEKVIGSGFEDNVSKLALEDGIAHRAARKNMQIHSAIILKINGKFSGFFTFQNNHEIKEFCLLQSVIEPNNYSDDLYRDMVLQVISQNKNNYPAFITTDPRSTFETPKLFEGLGFKTYLKMSGFHYMILGDISEARMKLLAHITMTNVWNSTAGDWLRLKKEWKDMIEERGIKYSIPNPMFATRNGAWQGESGFANVVTGHAHNGNASVLDPVVCEICLRFFIPKYGRRIYNPFGGGVQFGFIAGHYGYEYIATEIRQNQCDANNQLCSEYPLVKWIKADSSSYEPEGMFDLAFACPPYFRVEKYLDYDGKSPQGEINSFKKYEEFEEALFSGYKITIDHLKENCFFVIMTGDSRDQNGAYHCSEARTELFLKNNGMKIYNRIVYVEGEFTRLAQAKKTLNYRKFPKREQKIIISYKGDIDKIKDLYLPIGRL